MPRISVSIQQSGEVLSYEIAGDLTISTLKEFISAESGIPAASQTVIHNGRALGNDEQTLDAAGITDDDMLAVTTRRQQSGSGSSGAQPQSRTQQQPRQSQQTSARDAEIEGIRQHFLNNPQLRDRIRREAPRIAETLQDPVRFHAEYLRNEEAIRAREAQQQEEITRLENDVTAENQEKIAELIRQQAIERDMQSVLEDNPELFGRVTMLYVPVEVNGHPVKAFVDSGAQATIMSPSCAEACGVTRLIDKRFAGIARGVGTAKILGKVHKADIRIGDAELPCSFTVMEGKDVDMLLGLDMLKRYQACIDLAQNKLLLAGGSVSVSFLGESEIPKTFEEAMANEETAPGPEGSRIGLESGAVKPPPSPSSSAGKAPASASASAALAGERTFRGFGATYRPGPVSSSPPPASASAAATAGGSNFRGSGAALGSPPPSSPSPATAPRVSRGSAQDYPQSSIDSLVRLGASPEQAVQLLTACDGNVEAAASILFGI